MWPAPSMIRFFEWSPCQTDLSFEATTDPTERNRGKCEADAQGQRKYDGRID